MTDLFTWGHLLVLILLVALQVVLSVDNLLYISLISKQAAPEKQKKLRQIGIGFAIIFRIILLFVIVNLISLFQNPFLTLHFDGVLEAELNLHSLIVLLGGAFIIYTAFKEIWHLVSHDDLSQPVEKYNYTSSLKIISMIVAMNLVFSFDSILAAIGLTNDLENTSIAFAIMSLAIIFSGVIMIVLAEKVSAFLQKNRLYEVLGLFILFIVGIMLLSEGGHLAELKIFGEPVEAMNNTTFYFIIFVLIAVDVVQSSYQKKLLKDQEQDVILEKAANAEK